MIQHPPSCPAFLLALLFGTLPAAAAAQSDNGWFPGQGLDVAGSPGVIRPIDLDGHGRDELALLDEQGSIVLLAWRGAGVLSAPLVVETEDAAIDLRIGDLDGDGLDELVTVVPSQLPDPATLVVHRATGNPVDPFGAPVVTPLTLALSTFSVQRGQALALGDLDEDGDVDAVVATGVSGTNRITLLFNDGLGGFGNETFLTVGLDPRGITLVDLDDDGHLDVLAMIESAAFPGRLSWHAGFGDGTFASGVKSDLDGELRTVQAADLDGDGDQDVLASWGSFNVGAPRGLSVFWGAGDGTLEPGPITPTAQVPVHAQLVDLRGDPLPELVLAGNGGSLGGFGLLTLHEGDAAGGFATFDTVSIGFPGGLLPVHADDDGLWDVVVSEGFVGSAVRVWHGDATGGLTAAVAIPLDDLPTSGNGLAVGDSPQSLAAADVTGDGVPDIVGGMQASPALLIVAGDGSLAPVPTEVVPVGFPAIDLEVVDMNGDGYGDVVAVGGAVAVLLGGPRGGDVITQAGIGILMSVDAGDMDGDGLPDVVAAGVLTPHGMPLLFPGKGDGSLGAPVPIEGIQGLPADMQSIALGDLDLDGELDLVSGFGGGAPIVALLSSPTGLSTPVVLEERWLGVLDLAVQDLGDDGKPDVVATLYAADAVWVGTGGGDGSLAARAIIAVPDKPFRLVVQDLDGDGVQDLAVSRDDAVSLVVLPGAGNGSFGSPRSYASDRFNRAITSTDLDGDGAPELLVSPQNAPEIMVLPNLGAARR